MSTQTQHQQVRIHESSLVGGREKDGGEAFWMEASKMLEWKREPRRAWEKQVVDLSHLLPKLTTRRSSSVGGLEEKTIEPRDNLVTSPSFAL
ncbi:hypothetical protein BT69DRAFT_1340800 [Atractiella rhizophila]|nr:hypothetical protein BT69DRAFT_1340800 [Atractiella rhizophila]